MAIRAAVLSDNYVCFFRMCHDCPFETHLLTSKLTPHMRFRALTIISRTYRPTKFPLISLQRILEFDSLQECSTFATHRGAVLTSDGKSLNTKEYTEIHRPIPE